MKNIINDILSKFDAQIVRKSSYDKLLEESSKVIDFKLAERLDKNYIQYYFNIIEHSKSQLRQDLFVLSESGFKKNGFFVEFGATNGVDFSNTHLLEKHFGWNGILAEPAKTWHKDLFSNRSASIEMDCVWKSTGDTLVFNEVDQNKNNRELSTIDRYSDTDRHYILRRNGNKYSVNTISLIDMLYKYNAPKKIDYLSIDTEGSEFEILNSFDFNTFDIKIITCEHNYTPMRDKIFNLLTRNGYERKHIDISLFDDWYVRC